MNIEGHRLALTIQRRLVNLSNSQCIPTIAPPANHNRSAIVLPDYDQDHQPGSCANLWLDSDSKIEICSRAVQSL